MYRLKIKIPVITYREEVIEVSDQDREWLQTNNTSKIVWSRMTKEDRLNCPSHSIVQSLINHGGSLVSRIDTEVQGLQPRTKFFEIVKTTGQGTMESPSVDHRTGLIYRKEEDAVVEANKLWLENTDKEERASTWCSLHYSVVEVIM